MTVIMIQSKLKAESVADVQAAITKMLIAVDAANSKGSATRPCCCPTARRWSPFCRSTTEEKIRSQICLSTGSSWKSSSRRG